MATPVILYAAAIALHLVPLSAQLIVACWYTIFIQLLARLHLCYILASYKAQFNPPETLPILSLLVHKPSVNES